MNSLANISEFPLQVIAASGLTDLPASRRKKLREVLENMLMLRITNELLSHLPEENYSDFIQKSVDLQSMTEFFQILFREIPNAETIINEESEMLFEELTR